MGYLYLYLSEKQKRTLNKGQAITAKKSMEGGDGADLVNVTDTIARRFNNLKGNKGMRLTGSIAYGDAVEDGAGFGNFAKGLAKGIAKQVIKKGVDSAVDAAVGGSLMSNIGRQVAHQVVTKSVDHLMSGGAANSDLPPWAYEKPSAIREHLVGPQLGGRMEGGRVNFKPVGRAFKVAGQHIAKFARSKSVRNATRTVGKAVAKELTKAAKDPNMTGILREEGRNAFEDGVQSRVGKIKNRSLNRIATTYTDNVANNIYRRDPDQVDAIPEADVQGGSGIRRLQKGSAEMKERMAKLRAMRKGGKGSGFRGIR